MQKSVLLYGYETWEITQTITHKLQTSVNRSVRIVINSRWPEVISKYDVWGKTKQKPIKKGKAVPLHSMEELGGRGGIAPTHSRPRH
jgi:hypothetical protein